MTYGSILATLGQLCAFCINPRLAMRGQVRTKHLASRWDEPGRKVRIWWDDCVPVDPQQVNSDLAEDRANLAVTPNEVRALRGRKSYRAGGDDPMGQGPAGLMPIPLNTGDTLSDLAKLIAPMAEATSLAHGKPEEPADTDGEAGDRGWAASLSANGEEEGDGVLGASRIANPNGKPSKALPGKKGIYYKELGEPLRLLDLPDIRQPDNYSCGASITASVARYFGIGLETGTGPKTVEEWKKLLGTTIQRSTSPDAILTGLESVGLEAIAQQNMTVEDLAQACKEGKPVICPIQEYGAPDKKADYAYGHYVAVIGVAMGQVFVQDPAIDNVMEGEGADAARGRMMIEAGKFEGIWHDEDTEGNRYFHYGIIVSPKEPGKVIKPTNRLKGLLNSSIELSGTPGSTSKGVGYKKVEDLKRGDALDVPWM